jgi:hypothetical protein
MNQERHRAARRWRAWIGLGAIVLALAAAAAWARGVAADRGSVADNPAEPRVQIYPTADRLPANTLRVYLLFDRPMSAGESRAHLRLVDDGGRQVEGAFLHLEEELWDPSGRRLTVLFDPGRIKRGLKANLESGAPLVEGRRYRLIVDGGWRDGEGRPLRRDVEKAFEVVAPDRTSPALDEWTIEPPAAGTTAPLVVRFPEVLDRALLSSAIAVVDESGAPVVGEIDVSAGERAWSLTPTRAWRAGKYGLRVSADLEDVAGNSLRRVFDADLSTPSGASESGPATLQRAFEVTGAQSARSAAAR